MGQGLEGETQMHMYAEVFVQLCMHASSLLKRLREFLFLACAEIVLHLW
jgi:hypothetical protein